ncbi:putative small lipoprotein YifL [Nocardioides aromaticivorans]|uniref:Putative small lipoprotein YifL n=1 Tax=Nocardioides aromaticivorans TaxID=200618 RepID=A0A7Z0CN45_9ACTN|nr:hypothetical protein [Nocardioides aromaticivorans]NYI44803.1 putative small lipoprotein YifL [Nocardioides aromaticivorans]
MRLRRLWPAALLALAPVLAACGDDEPDAADEQTTSAAPTTDAPSQTPTEESSATEAPTETTSAPPVADRPQACALLTSGDVAKAIGVEFSEGVPGHGSVTENGTSWTTDECTFTAKDLVSIRIEVSGPADVTAGKFGCIQPSDADGNVEPSDAAGASKAWWKTSATPPLVATLRACSAEANVDVTMTYEDGTDYPGDPSQQAPQLAGLVLSGLQG